MNTFDTAAHVQYSTYNSRDAMRETTNDKQKTHTLADASLMVYYIAVRTLAIRVLNISLLVGLSTFLQKNIHNTGRLKVWQQ